MSSLAMQMHAMQLKPLVLFQPVANARPPLKKVILHLAKLHFVVQPLGLPLFYVLMKRMGVRFTSPTPPWLEFKLPMVYEIVNLYPF